MTDFPLPAHPLSWPPMRARRWTRDVVFSLVTAVDPRPRLLAEKDRWFLWSPVCLGTGIGIYFALPFEPSWLTAAAAALLPALAGVAAFGFLGRSGTERSLVSAVLAAALMLGGVGFFLAKLRTEMVRAPVLARDQGPVHLSGHVLYAEDQAGGRWRVVIVPTAISGLSPEETPRRVRVVSRQGAKGPRPGDRVRALVILRPPPAPSTPWSYDFARQAWFSQLGAVGFTLGSFQQPEPGSDKTPPIGLSGRLAALRLAISQRVEAALPGAPGQVAAALMTGQRQMIPEKQLEEMRASGLAHLLAISGLHMALVGGLLFAATRQILALIPFIAVRYPIKKWAAVAGLLGSLGYLAISGGSPATQRAFFMAACVFIAILTDRAAITLRTLAVAALGLLVLFPESLVNISFQMSFAALVALVSFYEAIRNWRAEERQKVTRSRPAMRIASKFAHYMVALAATTIVAEIATGLIAAYHFNRIVMLGVVANLLAMPVVGLVIMPCLLASLLLMPLNLEAVALKPMGWGIESVLTVAHRIGGRPDAELYLPHMPAASLILLASAGLWLCLWRGSWRFWGLALIPAALFVAVKAPEPFLMVERNGKNIAVVLPAESGGWERVAVLFPRRSSFEQEQWARHYGTRDVADATETGTFVCDSVGCAGRDRFEHKISYILNQRGFAEECGGADIIVTPLVMPWSIKQNCRRSSLVIDKWSLWRGGAHAVFDNGRGALSLVTARQRRGVRPWSEWPSGTGRQKLR